MAAGIVLVLLMIFRQRLEKAIVAKATGKSKDMRQRKAWISFWVIEGFTMGVILLSLVAITLSETGIHEILTQQKIETWLLEKGSGILVIIIGGFFLWYFMKKLIVSVLRRAVVRPAGGESREGWKRRMDTLQSIFIGLGRLLIILGVIFLILSELEVPIGPILAGFGVAGIAVGFGAQYLIRDLIAGIFVIMENQYRVGDVAKVADTIGLVEEINLRKTVLRDLDGIVHHVPNGEIRVASNYSRHYARVNLNISVSYGTDLDKAIQVINQVCADMAQEEEWRKVFINVPKVLRIDKLGDSGIEIKILGDTRPLEQWRTMGELRLRLKKAFDAEGIEIPWPHTKLYFGNSPEDVKGKSS
jgi:small conductance mechanosensitive channel